MRRPFADEESLRELLAEIDRSIEIANFGDPPCDHPDCVEAWHERMAARRDMLAAQRDGVLADLAELGAAA